MCPELLTIMNSVPASPGKLRQNLRSHPTSHTSPTARSTSPPGEGASIRPEGRFMIVASFGQIATETGHDHAVLIRLARAKGRASMDVSLLSAVGECVEAVRSAIPRLCA